MSRDSLLVAACMRAGVRLFVIRGKAPTAELAKNFVVVEHRVRLLVARHPGPFIAKVFQAKDGTNKSLREAVEMYLTQAEWTAKYR